MRSLTSRVKVIGPAFLAGAVLSALAASSGASGMGWSLADAAEVWASVLAGPFSGLWACATWSVADAVGYGVVCGMAVLAHPLREGWLSGTVSAAGGLIWVLLGFMLTYDGV